MRDNDVAVPCFGREGEEEEDDEFRVFLGFEGELGGDDGGGGGDEGGC